MMNLTVVVVFLHTNKHIHLFYLLELNEWIKMNDERERKKKLSKSQWMGKNGKIEKERKKEKDRIRAKDV